MSTIRRDLFCSFLFVDKRKSDGGSGGGGGLYVPHPPLIWVLSQLLGKASKAIWKKKKDLIFKKGWSAIF